MSTGEDLNLGSQQQYNIKDLSLSIGAVSSLFEAKVFTIDSGNSLTEFVGGAIRTDLLFDLDFIVMTKSDKGAFV